MSRALSWLRDSVVTAALIFGQAVLSLRHNWGLGVLSIALAASLWVFVTDRQDADRTGRVSGAVPVEVVNVPAGQAVFSLSQDAVSVRVRAPESVFDDLTADDFVATINLSGVTGGQATVPVTVDPQVSRVQLEEISPPEVTVTLENVTSRTLPITTELVGAPPRGFQIGETTIDPQQAVVSGPESLVGRVASVEADINLTGARTDFEQTLLLQARDEADGAITGVDVEPERALVRVQVEQLETSAAFVVRPQTSGAPAEGYNVTGISVEPAIVFVSGPAEVLESIDAAEGIATVPVSIDAATADVVRTVSLELPEGARVTAPGVTVRVTITPTSGRLTFTIGPQPVNVPSGLTPRLSPDNVQVVLGGALPELSTLSEADVRATVNLEGLDVGEHDLPVRVQAPQGTRLVSITPTQVQVTLREQ